MKAVLEEQGEEHLANSKERNRNKVRIEKPGFLNKMGIKGMRIGSINMEEEDLSEWEDHGNTVTRVPFEKVSELFEWKDIFPEWIDEEQENEGYLCPEIPMPKFDELESVDVVVAKLPCKLPEAGWGRDMHRLQVHLIAANMLAKKGKKDWYGRTRVVFLSKCRPMMELFRCDDLVKREGDWWYFEPDMVRLEQKVSCLLYTSDAADE